MISYTPIPNWSELASFLLGRQLTDLQLADPWRKNNESAFWFSRAAWALEAISLYVEGLNDKIKPTVWIPDFFCNGSLWPIRSTGADIVFYPVDLDLEPKWDACQELALTKSPDLFVLVHYFGTPANAEKAHGFCADQNALLVEDAAHATGPISGIGDYGDFVLYSPYKILPIPNGGLLLVKDESICERIKQICRNQGDPPPSTRMWLAKKLVQKILPGLISSLSKNRNTLSFGDDPPYVPLSRNVQLSPSARRMINKSAQSLEQIGTQRADNAAMLEKTIKAKSPFEVWPTANNTTVPPYRFALKFNDMETAEAYYQKFTYANLPAESWPDLPPEIFDDIGLHQDAITLRQTIVYLPAHQNLKMLEYTAVLSTLS
jgi:dTDP-4-amino-4,6-dideoxygalactose transaminase